MKKIESFLEFLVSVTLVLNCNSIWGRHIIPKQNTVVLYVCIILLILMSIKVLLKNKKIFLRLVFLIMSVNIINLIFIIFNKSNVGDYINKFIILFSCLIIFSTIKAIKGEVNNLLIKVSNFVCFLAIISLIIYIIGPILNIVHPNSSVLINWGTERYVDSYYNFLYVTQDFTLNGVKLVRNTGIFTEAPMYSFILSIALSTKLFLEKGKKIYIIMLTATILTTLSTTGIVFMCGMFLFKYIMNNQKKGYKKLIKIVSFPLILAITLSISVFFINDKIESSKNSMGSYSIRLDDFRVGIELWDKSKIIGLGYENYDIAKKYVNPMRGTDIGGSSGIMHIIAQGGVILLLINIVPYILIFIICIRDKRISKNYGFICVMMIGLLLVTAVQYTYISIYYLAWALSIYLCKNINFRRNSK